MKKRTGIILGSILGLIVLLFLILTLTLDQIVKSNIQSIGSDILKTELTVDNVSISPFTGEGTLEGLTIANPEGYEGEEAMTIRTISIRMDPLTVLSDTVMIHEVVVQSMEVFFEVDPSGSNLGELHGNVQAYSAETESTYDAAMVIEYFLMEESTLTATSSVGDMEPVEIQLSRMELENIGRAGNADIASTMKTVLEVILARVAQEGFQRFLQQGGREMLEEAGDAIRNLFDDN